MARAYLDYNATSPLRPEARAAAIDALNTLGNPSSVHAEGRAARGVVETARENIAALIGADPRRVTLTGGGSEANTTVLTPNWQRKGQPLRLNNLVVSSVEHPSVRAGGRFEAEAIKVVPVDGNGVIDLEALEHTLANIGEPSLVSVMAANNETGVLQPVVNVGEIAGRYGCIVHVDAVQVAGRVPFDLEGSGADVLTLSGHKLGAPAGVGAIAQPNGSLSFAPLVLGGGQESRRRAGTEPLSAIAGFGAAAKAAQPEQAEMDRQKALLDQARRIIGNDVVVFGDAAERLPQTLCFAVPGVNAETLVIGLDLEGVAVSSGAACSSGKVEPSHVLEAMGVSADLARGAIRLSLGFQSGKDDIDLFARAWRNVVSRLRR